MKTIEVTDEIYEKLIELAKEMDTQDPRGTRMPHIFQIRNWKKVYDWNWNGDVKIWIDQRGDYNEIETLGDLIEYLEDNEIEFEREEIEEMWKNQDILFDSSLEDWIEENCPNLERCSYSLEEYYINSFLTAKAAQEHLDSNDYHYHRNSDVYLNHAWRNPEAELVSEFLLSLIGKSLYR